MAEGSTTTRFTWHGATLVAESDGARDGPGGTFVLLHGIGMGRRVFTDLTERLGTDARVVAIDLPGYGDAPEPHRTLTVERHADVVAAYLRTRSLDDVTLVGHSLGSQIAVEVAARHPSSVARIVLAGPTVDPAARRARVQLARLARDIAIESPVVWARGAREYLHAGPNLRAKMRAMLVHRPEDALPHIDKPALVLRGSDDVVVPPAWGTRVADLLPRGRLIEIADHGHETMIRDAAPAAAAILAFTHET